MGVRARTQRLVGSRGARLTRSLLLGLALTLLLWRTVMIGCMAFLKDAAEEMLMSDWWGGRC